MEQPFSFHYRDKEAAAAKEAARRAARDPNRFQVSGRPSVVDVTIHDVP